MLVLSVLRVTTFLHSQDPQQTCIVRKLVNFRPTAALLPPCSSWPVASIQPEDGEVATSSTLKRTRSEFYTGQWATEQTQHQLSTPRSHSSSIPESSSPSMSDKISAVCCPKSGGAWR